MAHPYQVPGTEQELTFGEQPQQSPVLLPRHCPETPTAGTLLIFLPEVICQLHLFLASVLGDEDKEGKQITAQAHLPFVSSHRQQSTVCFPEVPRKSL